MKWLRTIPVQHPNLTLVLGVTLLIAAGIYGFGIFPKLTSDDNSFNAIGTESTKVADILKRDFDTASSSSVVLFETKSRGQTVDSQAVQTEVERLLTLLGPSSQTTYYTTHVENFISHDKHSTYALVNLEGDATTQAKKTT